MAASRAGFTDRIDAVAIATLVRWIGAAGGAEIAAVLAQASRGMLGAAKAEERQALAATSAGLPDPLDAVAVAVRTLVAHGEHRDGQIAALGTRRRSRAGAARTARRSSRRSSASTCASRDVRVSESGVSAGRPKMSKRGNRYLRRSLMLAAESAARTDPQCRAILAKHRGKGKHYRVAVSHVARKLVHILYALLTHARPYTLPPAYVPQPEPPTEGLIGA